MINAIDRSKCVWFCLKKNKNEKVLALLVKDGQVWYESGFGIDFLMLKEVQELTGPRDCNGELLEVGDRVEIDTEGEKFTITINQIKYGKVYSGQWCPYPIECKKLPKTRPLTRQERWDWVQDWCANTPYSRETERDGKVKTMRGIKLSEAEILSSNKWIPLIHSSLGDDEENYVIRIAKKPSISCALPKEVDDENDR